MSPGAVAGAAALGIGAAVLVGLAVNAMSQQQQQNQPVPAGTWFGHTNQPGPPLNILASAGGDRADLEAWVDARGGPGGGDANCYDFVVKGIKLQTGKEFRNTRDGIEQTARDNYWKDIYYIGDKEELMDRPAKHFPNKTIILFNDHAAYVDNGVILHMNRPAKDINIESQIRRANTIRGVINLKLKGKYQFEGGITKEFDYYPFSKGKLTNILLPQ